MQTFESGPVPPEIANQEIENYKTIMLPARNIIEGIMEISGRVDPLNNFFSSDKNAFVFEKAEVLRHFNDPQATHLIVVLGAHIEEDGRPFKTGSPTAIIAGVHEEPVIDQNTTQPNQTTYVQSNPSEDPGEYPEQTTFPGFQAGLEGKGRIVFNVQ
jgi:hypothetical protein